MKYLILLVLFSCAQTRVEYDITSVSLNTDDKETLEIDKNSQSDYGPSKEVISNEEEKKRKAIVSLTLYSSIYHSLPFIEFIKQIEKKNLNISMISSQGFGSVLAALYAKEKSSSYLEWKLFDLLKRIKNLKPYTSEWKEILSVFIKEEFGVLKVSQLKLLLLIPQLVDGKVSLVQNSSVVEVLNSSLNLSNKHNFFYKPKNYIEEVELVGPDLSFSISFIPKVVQFKTLNGLEWGIYTRYLGHVMKSDSSIYVMRSERSSEIDNLEPLSDITKDYAKQINEYVQVLEQKIKEWQEESTTSLI
jgi:hypothetical protein